ncbi:unnamed protein product [Cuscuta campestris]|uniref:Disease resistance N-terminal domain-containing protein n=1 Tax=Cuscuta campestris TaxID=132261 RepID=A0A484NBB1_9ASTE|nr:unnamed protein product [Cuscuta campestris]
MAEAVLSIVAEGVLGKLFSLAAEELCSLWGFKKLEMIQALMIDAESKQTGSMTVQFWIKKLMAVSFEADNVLEEFAYEISKQKQGSNPIQAETRFLIGSAPSPPFSQCALRYVRPLRIYRLSKQCGLSRIYRGLKSLFALFLKRGALRGDALSGTRYPTLLSGKNRIGVWTPQGLRPPITLGLPSRIWVCPVPTTAINISLRMNFFDCADLYIGSVSDGRVWNLAVSLDS